MLGKKIPFEVVKSWIYENTPLRPTDQELFDAIDKEEIRDIPVSIRVNPLFCVECGKQGIVNNLTAGFVHTDDFKEHVKRHYAREHGQHFEPKLIIK